MARQANEEPISPQATQDVKEEAEEKVDAEDAQRLDAGVCGRNCGSVVYNLAQLRQTQTSKTFSPNWGGPTLSSRRRRRKA